MHRNARFADRLPHALLRDEYAIVVGVGAIGHQVARLLATMDIPLQLFDPDTVSPLNFGPQFYPPSCHNIPKVVAASTGISTLNPSLSVTGVDSVFHPNKAKPTATAVFCCADSMKARRFVGAWAREQVADPTHPLRFFCEARMSSETFEVRAANSGPLFVSYESSLFDESEAEALPCADKSTPYCASMAASTMVSLYTQHLRKFDLPHVVIGNLLDCSITPEYAT